MQPQTKGLIAKKSLPLRSRCKPKADNTLANRQGSYLRRDFFNKMTDPTIFFPDLLHQQPSSSSYAFLSLDRSKLHYQRLYIKYQEKWKNALQIQVNLNMIMSDLGDLYPEGGESAILHYRVMAARTCDCADEVDNMWKQIRSKSTNCTDHDKIQLFDKAFEDYETCICDFTRLEQDFDKLNTHLVTNNGIDLVERDMKVIIANSDDGSKHEMHISNYHSLKGVLKSYAEDFSIPVNTCRLIYKGKMIFLSQSGKKTMMALGIEDGDVIQIGINHFREDNTTHSSAKGASVKAGSKKNNKISKVKGSKKNKSKSSSTFLAKLEPTKTSTQ